MLTPSDFPAPVFPDARFSVGSWVSALFAWPPLQAITPIFILLLVAPPVWFLFRKTWRELDEERRAHVLASSETDHRPIAALLLVAVVLTLHEYYGGRSFYIGTIEPSLKNWEKAGSTWIRPSVYSDLYGYLWWATARILGYVIAPIALWKILFRKDSILDMGLRSRGFLTHLPIYALCLAAVFGAMFVVVQSGGFLTYYPFYKGASRSWFDLLAWEAAYFAQFLALEFFFRGWMLDALRRSLGSAAIFVMAVPYCMIHYGKPYLETHGAIVAGVVLGSLAMRTRSIYAGCLVHILVAGLMDAIALSARGGFPKNFWP